MIRVFFKYGAELAVCGLFAFNGYAWLYLGIVLFGAFVAQGFIEYGSR